MPIVSSPTVLLSLQFAASVASISALPLRLDLMIFKARFTEILDEIKPVSWVTVVKWVFGSTVNGWKMIR